MEDMRFPLPDRVASQANPSFEIYQITSLPIYQFRLVFMVHARHIAMLMLWSRLVFELPFN